MPLTKLQFKPGVNRETTSYSNEGGWFDSEKVRFRSGYPEKIGGWVRYSNSAFLGDCRGLHPFVALDGTKYIGVGTHLKYYINQGGTFNDITPIRLTTSAGDATFAASNGSSTLTVTESSHSAVVGDFVTFSGAATLGGLITANVLNQEYQIVSVVNANSYTIEAREVATIESITTTSGLNATAVSANSSDSGNGGGSVVATYQTSVGLQVSIEGTGWGAGVYGRGTWNSNADVSISTTSMRIWTHDNFGEDLIINVRDGVIGYYDTSGGLSTRAVLLKDVSGANTTPTIAKKVIVSDRDRHVIAFGCDPQTNIGTQDPLLIRFSSQESITDWESTATNTAGDLRIGSGSQIITAVETRREIVVFTDVSLHSMQFIGPPFTFGINAISENITIAGPLAAVAVEDAIYWMGVNEFYAYAGTVQRIPCSVKDFVFSDINREQIEKVTAGVNSSFAEIWWFYPSASSTENDKYVIYNYEQKIWYFGTLTRTFWMDRGIYEFPIAAGSDHYLFNHEDGFDDGSTVPATAISSHIQSSQIDIGDGNNFVFINRVIPDITFRSSTVGSPSATFTLQTRNFPGGSYLQTTDQTITRTASESSTVVEQYTNQANIRLRGRSFALKVASTGTEIGWRLGSPRVDVRPDGRR
jgi:hypothetical protein